MEEVKAVTDILEDALSKIKNVTGSTQSPQNQTNSTSSTASSTRQTSSTGETHTHSTLLARAQSNFRQIADRTNFSSKEKQPIKPDNDWVREVHWVKLSSKLMNFQTIFIRSSFPQFYSTVHSSQRETWPRKKQRSSPFAAWVKDTWTHDFVLLSSTTAGRTPTPQIMQQLQSAGLGRKEIVFKDKQGGFDHLRETLEKEFPKLETQKGAFELLRADRGGYSRPLLSIPMSNLGYTIKHLKEAVSGSAAIYVRPIQSDLDMTPISSAGSQDGETVYTQCVCCQEHVPLLEMKSHASTCKSKEINSESVTSSISVGTITTNANNLPGSEIETIVVDENNSDKDLTLMEDDSNMYSNIFPTSDVKANWTEQLQEMFPDVLKTNIESSVNVSVSLEEAAEIVCDGINDLDKPKEKDDDLSDLLAGLAAKIQDSDYMLTVERDEVWSAALTFYKKALLDKTKLWQDLTIIFKGEEGLDAGTIRTEFFEILLREINFRLFEGQELSQLPVRDSNKAMLLKLAA
ncbi:E3 ubiquitin- ligase pub2, partial [Paramuricea clavata]